MARKRGDDSIDIKILVKPDVEKEFLAFVERTKSKSNGEAVERLLKMAKELENYEAKKDGADAGGEKEGRATRKGKKEEPAGALEKNGKNGAGEHGGDDAHPMELKRSPVKKAGGQKGKKTDNDGGDATFNVDDDQPAEVPPPKADKKGKKGKQAPAAHSDDNGDEGDRGAAAATGKTTAGQKDDGDAPDAKKRRGKVVAVVDDKGQEPEAAATSRRGIKKTTSTSSVVDAMQAEEPKEEAQGETKGRGKKKTAKGQDEGAAAQPEPSATAAKPKRTRAAKTNKNYAEEGDEAM